jgi:SAM-dependent methyltransferase
MEQLQSDLKTSVIAAVDGVDWSLLTIEEQVLILRSMQAGIRRWKEHTGFTPEMSGHFVEHSGYCPCCRARAVFRADDPWLRDMYVCTSCWSIPRQRNVFRALDEVVPNWTKRTIHESSPGDGLIPRLARDYSMSQFVDNVPLGGKLPKGGTCQNLEKLAFPDNTFDVFITQDVMEHVFDVSRALNEIIRVLKPGGVHLFTTPRFKHLPTTVQRAAMTKSEIDYLLPAMYHGNPIGDGRALVTFDWGSDVEALYESWTGVPVTTIDTVDRERGIDGAYFEVFVMRKPG